MSNFQEDEKLEEKLREDPREFSFGELSRLQTYKAQKLKAKRDSGMSNETPEWWPSDQAPETMDELAEMAKEMS